MDKDATHQVKQLSQEGNAAEFQGRTVAPPPFSLAASPIAPVAQCQLPMCGPEGGESESSEPLECLAAEVPEVAPALEAVGLPINEEMRGAARSRYRIPERGWRDTRSADRTARTMTLAPSIDELSEIIRTNPAAIAHIRETIDMFVNDPDPRTAMRAEDIDIPLIMAIANRESAGDPLFLPPAGGTEAEVEAWSQRRVVTGGGDAHRQGRGGLDNVGEHRSRFPRSIRDEVQAVEGHPTLDAGIMPRRRGRVNPGYLPQGDLLAAYIVEIRIYQERFERQFRSRATRRGAFNAAQAEQLLQGLTTDGRRAWIQASFGSRLSALLGRAVTRMQTRYRQELRTHTEEEAFATVLNDDTLNLNALVNEDTMMDAEGLSGHRTRLTVAESWMMEESLPADLLEYRHGETPECTTAAPSAEAGPMMCQP